MDNFTVSTVSQGDLQPVASEHKAPSKRFRLVFLLLLLATLASALATTYILMTGKTLAPTPTKSPAAVAPVNPFASDSAQVNPFSDPSQLAATSSGNPFADSQSTNPFDTFDTSATTPSSAANPF
jgi:hypothetical protein